jgi:hypothetical protein
MRRRGLFVKGGAAGEIRTRPAHDARRRGCGRRPPDRVVPGLPTPSGAGSRRASPPLRCRDARPRVARAACVLSVRRPSGRFRGDRREAIKKTRPLDRAPLLGRRRVASRSLRNNNRAAVIGTSRIAPTGRAFSPPSRHPESRYSWRTIWEGAASRDEALPSGAREFPRSGSVGPQLGNRKHSSGGILQN